MLSAKDTIFKRNETFFLWVKKQEVKIKMKIKIEN